MKISVFGMGYVGCVGMGCLAKMEHQVIGVDVSPLKVELIQNGKATVVEKDIDELIESGVTQGRISATTDARQAVLGSDISFICVGTPNLPTGHLDMTAIEAVSAEIGRALAEKGTHHVVVIRSTVMPGTNRKLVNIIGDAAGKPAGDAFGVVSNPEFLREGSAVADFFNPPYTVIASDTGPSLAIMEQLYAGLNGDVIRTDIEVAEIIKFLNNSYHALKVAFGNEVGRICKAMNVDSRQLMDLFCKDTILNISPYYFKPGFAYGGSCLPKDLKALNLIAHDRYVDVPILAAVSPSNEAHIGIAEKMILDKNPRRIGFASISFKPGTDDLRFSPALELTERLIGRGMELAVFDRNLNLSRLMGKNKDFLFEKLPHIDRILVDSMDELVSFADLIVIANNESYITDYFQAHPVPEGVAVLDLAGTLYGQELSGVEGICW